MSKKFPKKGKSFKSTGVKYAEDSSVGVPDIRSNNMISWWSKLSAISSSAANLVTGIPQGDAIPETVTTLATIGNARRGRIVPRRYPGIIRINRIPVWGMTGANHETGKSDMSYLNRAASQFYWTVNHANSRDRSYDKADLFSCLINIDNILQCIAQCVRVYGLAKKFSSTNKFLGRSLIEACGFSYSIVANNNLAQFLYRLNVCIHQLNKFYIPNIVDMFAEHMNDLTRVYCDEPTENAQLMVVNNLGYYRYSDETGKFTWQVEANLRTMNYFDTIDAMISDVYNSQYMGIMNADMRKCFGESACVKLPEIPVDYTTEICYDKEFNLKLRNANFVGSNMVTPVLGLNSTHVDELESIISIESGPEVIASYDKVIYFNNDEPADVVNYLLATRFKFLVDAEITGSVPVIKECGSEILTTIDVCRDPNGASPTWLSNASPYINVVYAGQSENAWNLSAEILSYLSAYSGVLPFGLYYGVSEGSPVTRVTQNAIKLTNIENVGILEADEYQRLNYSAMASLYELTNITDYKVTSNGPSSIR